METNQHNEEPFGGFQVSSRSFCVRATDLSVVRNWGELGFEQDRNFSTSIHGSADLAEDSVCVIGSDKITSTMSLRIWSDERARVEWQKERQHERIVDEIAETKPDDRALRLRKFAFEILDEKPPTANLIFLDANEEFGSQPSWHIGCQIAPEVLDQLTQDLLEDRVAQASIRVRWVVGLVSNPHAPVYASTTWGLFKYGGQVEPLRGQVESIQWELRRATPENDGERGKFDEHIERLATVLLENNRKLTAEIGASILALTALLAKWVLGVAVVIIVFEVITKIIRFFLH
jgi:hypothetical protein